MGGFGSIEFRNYNGSLLLFLFKKIVGSAISKKRSIVPVTREDSYFLC